MRYLVIVLMMILAGCGSKVSCDSKEVQKLAISTNTNVMKSFLLSCLVFNDENVTVEEPMINYAAFKAVIGNRADQKEAKANLDLTDTIYKEQNVTLENIIPSVKEGVCTCNADLVFKEGKIVASTPVLYTVEKTTKGEIVVASYHKFIK